MATKRLLLVIFLAMVLCAPSLVMAEGSLLKGKPVTVEGTIEGLFSACTGQLCVPGQENVVAGVEDTYVLSVGKDQFYYLPNVKNTLLSRYVGKTVRVKGTEALGGSSIIVDTAEVMGDGGWTAFYSPEIRHQMIEKYKYAPYQSNWGPGQG
jgi:hypothetical protein